MTEKSLQIKYVANDTGVTKTLDNIGAKHQALATKLKALGTSIASAGKTMITHFTAPILAGFGVAIHLAEQNAAANRLLSRSFQQAGIVGTGALRAITLWNSNLSVKIGVSETALSQLEGRVVSMGHSFLKFLGPGAAQTDVQQLTLGMENLSAASGKSINMLMRSLAPAILTEPDKAATSLQKYGILTAGQVTQTKNLVAAGHANIATQMEINSLYAKNAGAAAKAATPTQKLMAALDRLGITVGRILMPVFMQLTSWVAKAAGWFDLLSPSAQKTAIKILAIAAAIGPVIFIVGKLISTFGTLFGLFSEGGALASLLSPWTLVIAAVAVAAYLIIKHWQGVKRVLVDIWHGLVAAWHAVWGAVGPIVKVALAPIIALIKVDFAIIKAVLGFLLDHWRGIWTGMKAIAIAIFGPIVAVVRAEIGAVKAVIDVLKKIWDAVWSAMKAAAVAIFGPIISAAQKAATFIASVFHAVIGSVSDAVSQLATKAAAAAAKVGGHAAGGHISRNELAIVGERGPELVKLPAGSTVYSNAQSVAMAGGLGARGGGGDTYVVVNVAGSVIAEQDIAKSIRKELLKLGRRNGGSTGL